MTDSDQFLALASYRMDQADEALRAAESNLKNQLHRSAANRAYYAMFYAVLALLAVEQRGTSRHSAAIALFDREFVKTARLPKELSRWLHAAFSMRQEADYGPAPTISVDQVRAAVGNASSCVAQAESFLNERSGLRSHGDDAN